MRHLVLKPEALEVCKEVGALVNLKGAKQIARPISNVLGRSDKVIK
jgi:hypothetical protein